MLDGFSPSPILSSEPVAELQSLITLACPPALRAAYTTPGQYAKLTFGEHKPGFFVIANAPGTDTLEFLIKEASPLTAELRMLPVGTDILMTPPMGKGFPCELARGQDVLFLGAGSGIAALRPVIQHILQDRAAYGALTLIYGERTPQRLAFADEIEDWATVGLRRHFCVSSPVSEATVDSAHQGYVQDLLRQVPLDCPRTVGFLSGMEAMLVACRETFAELGGDPQALHTNF